MLGFGWLVWRQAQEALRQGRLEEVAGLLGKAPPAGQQRWEDLRRQLVKALVERGEKALRRDDVTAAWRDLLQAENLGCADPAPQRLRPALARLGLAEIRALLEAGEPSRAAEACTLLRDRGVRQPELEPLAETAREWLRAQDLADRGEFAWAAQLGERMRRLWGGPLGALERFVHDLEERQRAFGSLVVELTESAQREDWPRVLQLSEGILALAPQHAHTRKLRSQAWRIIEPATVATMAVPQPASRLEKTAERASTQFLLWIDGVGGFLLCLQPSVTLGQASPEAKVDVPLLADVSRHHATLVRDNEGYVLEAVRSVQVNGQKVDRALLQSGDRVTLGTSCQFRFWLPLAISATARLELMSGHRLPWAVDCIILMADTLILGPGPQVHLPLPDLKQPLVLYRQQDALAINHPGTLVVNGQPCKDRSPLEPGTTVTGEGFSLALEAVGRKQKAVASKPT